MSKKPIVRKAFLTCAALIFAQVLTLEAGQRKKASVDFDGAADTKVSILDQVQLELERSGSKWAAQRQVVIGDLYWCDRLAKGKLKTSKLFGNPFDDALIATNLECETVRKRALLLGLPEELRDRPSLPSGSIYPVLKDPRLKKDWLAFVKAQKSKLDRFDEQLKRKRITRVQHEDLLEDMKSLARMWENTQAMLMKRRK